VTAPLDPVDQTLHRALEGILRRPILTGVLALAPVIWGCADETPTSNREDLFPLTVQTVEVRIPFDQFGSDFQVLGGFGSPVSLNQGLLARDFGDGLEARTLTRFQRFPAAVSARDTTGTLRSDSSATFLGGRVLLVMDSIRTPDQPVLIRAGALERPWHARTASWDWAVDTVGAREPWPEPGAGPVTVLDEATWDPAEGDTLTLDVDSATVASWSDTTDLSRGVRLEVEDPGVRISLQTVVLRLDARPSINPDTTVVVTVLPQDLTFVYDPLPDPPPDGMRVGGVPAWRTVFGVSLPETLDGPDELCQQLGCPFEVTPGAVNFAALVLTTRASPVAFQPDDTLALDVRPVLTPDRLPKAPLGSALTGFLTLPSEYFSTDPGRQIIVPITRFVRDAVRGTTEQGTFAPNTLALLSTFEPVSLSFASFAGPGSADEPVLRLILSPDEGVQLP